jgi:hypothetical protein
MERINELLNQLADAAMAEILRQGESRGVNEKEIKPGDTFVLSIIGRELLTRIEDGLATRVEQKIFTLWTEKDT